MEQLIRDNGYKSLGRKIHEMRMFRASKLIGWRLII